MSESKDDPTLVVSPYGAAKGNHYVRLCEEWRADMRRGLMPEGVFKKQMVQQERLEAMERDLARETGVWSGMGLFLSSRFEAAGASNTDDEHSEEDGSKNESGDPAPLDEERCVHIAYRVEPVVQWYSDRQLPSGRSGTTTRTTCSA